jgi:hypothetical protein
LPAGEAALDAALPGEEALPLAFTVPTAWALIVELLSLQIVFRAVPGEAFPFAPGAPAA